jgi:hypothetical protein
MHSDRIVWRSVVRTIAATACVGSALTAPASAQEFRQLPVALARLDLDLRPDFAADSLSGNAQLMVRNVTAEAVTRIPLELHRLMTVTRVTDGTGRALRADQAVVRYADNRRVQVNAVVVTLAHLLASGDSTTIVVSWSGFLTPYAETGDLYVRDHIDTAFTIIREDARAFPMIAVPNRAVNVARQRPEFGFSVRVTVPRGLVAAAGGRLVERSQRGDSVVFGYRSTEPGTFVNITIAPYHVIDEDGIRVYSFPADSAGARMVADAAHHALRRLAEWFGPMGGTPDLAVMEIPDGYGSQASLGAGIIQTAAAFRDKRYLGQLYHELSHLWNAPDVDAPSVRWNEGLAGLLENLLTRDLDGWTGMDAYVQRYLDSYLPRFAADSVNLVTPLRDYGRAGLTDLSYSVGYFMFYAIYETLGETTFNRVIGGYYQRHRIGGGTLDLLLSELKQAAPGKLDVLINEWVNSTRWYTRVRSGETLQQMIARYRGP